MFPVRAKNVWFYTHLFHLCAWKLSLCESVWNLSARTLQEWLKCLQFLVVVLFFNKDFQSQSRMNSAKSNHQTDDAKKGQPDKQAWWETKSQKNQPPAGKACCLKLPAVWSKSSARPSAIPHQLSSSAARCPDLQQSDPHTNKWCYC